MVQQFRLLGADDDVLWQRSHEIIGPTPDDAGSQLWAEWHQVAAQFAQWLAMTKPKGRFVVRLRLSVERIEKA